MQDAIHWILIFLTAAWLIVGYCSWLYVVHSITGRLKRVEVLWAVLASVLGPCSLLALQPVYSPPTHSVIGRMIDRCERWLNEEL